MLKCLLVDDSKVFLEQTLALFLKLNFQCAVTTSSSGQEALDMVREWKPDIVLLDLFLPDIDGLEVLKKIKTIDRETIVLMLTGWKDCESLKAAFSLGVFDYLTKPVEEIEFSLRISSAIMAKKEQLRRKHAEQNLIESEATLHSILDSLEDVVFRLSSDGIFEYLNPKVETLLGYSAKELLGKEFKIKDVVHPEDKKIFDQSLTHTSENACSDVEFRIIRPDGQVRWVRSRSSIRVSLDSQTPVITGILRDITGRKEMEEKLRKLSLFDELTGLYNRNYFIAETNRLRSGRQGPIGIIIFDVDNLKLINDTLGHELGDRHLRLAAAAIKSSFREGDVVARIGGDEFALLVENAGDGLMEDICRRTSAAVAGKKRSETLFPLSLSMGYALIDNPSKSIEDAIKEADDKMYRQKLQKANKHRSLIMKSLLTTIEKKISPNFETNAGAMETLVVEFAKAVSFPERSVSNLRLLAQVHNIGYASISPGILLKEGPLTEDEYREIHRHPELGMRVASASMQMASAADLVLKHHEYWDGSGYPLGLKALRIPIECRLFAVTDAYIAMRSRRPFRMPMTCEAAVNELKKCSGKQFDPLIVERFVTFIWDKCPIGN